VGAVFAHEPIDLPLMPKEGCAGTGFDAGQLGGSSHHKAALSFLIAPLIGGAEGSIPATF
jgi:hypothetical protein